MERRGPPPPVSLAKGRPLNGQSRGQLRLTRTSYAECPPDKQREARFKVESTPSTALRSPSHRKWGGGKGIGARSPIDEEARF